MSSRYVRLNREEFESFLDSSFEWTEADTPYGERAYDLPLPVEHLSVRLFSTIDKTDDEARSNGSDAIRCVVWNHRLGRPVGGRRKTLRIGPSRSNPEGWRGNLAPKIRDLYSNWKVYNVEMKCSECGDELAGRESEYGEFLSCTSCDYTQNLAEGVCPECGGFMDERESQYGLFLSCRDCDHTEDS